MSAYFWTFSVLPTILAQIQYCVYTEVYFFFQIWITRTIFPEYVRTIFGNKIFKVEKILKGSLNSIPSPSPSPSLKIQIMGVKVCLRFKGKTLLGVVNKLLRTKSLLTSTSNVLLYYLRQTFPPII